MKSRTTLMLLEITVMLFVFAVAAALCLKAFSASERISEESLARDEAVVLAQNAAELLKHTHGDVDAVANTLQGEDTDCELRITPIENVSPLLGAANVAVYYNGEEIFSIRAAWQEVAK